MIINTKETRLLKVVTWDGTETGLRPRLLAFSAVFLYAWRLFYVTIFYPQGLGCAAGELHGMFLAYPQRSKDVKPPFMFMEQAETS